MSEISWFNSRQEQEMHHFTKVSRPSMEYIQSHIQWFRGYFQRENSWITQLTPHLISYNAG